MSCFAWGESMHRFGWDFSIARRGPVSRSTFSAFLAPGYPVRSFTRPGCGLSRLGMTGNRIRRVGARGVATRGTPSRVAGSPPRSRGPASISGSGGPLRCGRSGRRHRQSLWRPAWIFLADARLDEGVVRFFYDSAHGVLGYSPGKRRIVVEKPDGKATPISSVIAIPNGRDEGACLAWLGSARPVFFMPWWRRASALSGLASFLIGEHGVIRRGPFAVLGRKDVDPGGRRPRRSPHWRRGDSAPANRRAGACPGIGR
uniref:Uncharacterized protein n=1 Tax=Candidatus Kentrum sp. TC TaxID=2126339 RepID=A0A450ZHJ1_9GAMM|nr:MAG: hypothetical protein BECKTC1821F_GA0114240_100240 [Candidatus Kentron sp. TC]